MGPARRNGPRYPFFLPVKVLGRVFRGKFCAGLKRLYRSHRLRCAGPASALAVPKQFNQLLRRPHRDDWVVYAKPAFGGPTQVLRYLGRYSTESLSPTIDSLHLTGSASPPDGRITPMEANGGR